MLEALRYYLLYVRTRARKGQTAEMRDELARGGGTGGADLEKGQGQTLRFKGCQRISHAGPVKSPGSLVRTQAVQTPGSLVILVGSRTVPKVHSDTGSAQPPASGNP